MSWLSQRNWASENVANLANLKYLTQILNLFGIPTEFARIPFPEFLSTEFHRNIDYTGIDDMGFLLDNKRDLHIVHNTWDCRKEL